MAERHGGPPRTIGALSEGLARHGVHVRLLTGDDPARGDVLLLPDAALVRTELLPVTRRLGVGVYPGFAPAIRAEALAGVTILHDNGIWSPANLAITRAAWAAGLPYVISPHGMLEPWALRYHKGRKAVAWRLYQHRALARSAGLLATAEPEYAALRALGLRAPVAVIANGVVVPPAPRATPTPGNRRTLLFLSRLHPKKNLIGLLDAWRIICSDTQFDGWTLRIAGPDEGGHRADVGAHIARLGLTARVVVAGAIAEADKADAFAAADLFVLPSFSENFGIVVTEALAHGVPVITTHGTPWAELPKRGCGWWVAPTPVALAGALGEAMSLDAAARTAMGAAGRDYVGAAFGWDRIAANTLGFYEWLLHGGCRPDYVDV